MRRSLWLPGRSDNANHGNVLGFSFRYFIQDLMKDGGAKRLAIDGAASAAATIRNGSYPLTAEFYAATFADNANPNVPRLLE